eukprot:ANDGO_00427.mRNA.1 Oligouridylate-binding protein 1C
MSASVPSRTIYIGNLDPRTDEASLALLSSPFGLVRHIKLVRDRQTGLSLGYGFVEFQSHDAARLALDSLSRSQSDLKLRWANTLNPSIQSQSQPQSQPQSQSQHSYPMNGTVGTSWAGSGSGSGNGSLMGAPMTAPSAAGSYSTATNPHPHSSSVGAYPPQHMQFANANNYGGSHHHASYRNGSSRPSVEHAVDGSNGSGGGVATDGGAADAVGFQVFVGDLPNEIVSNELYNSFAKFGRIVEHRIMLEPVTGRSRGYAFVTFATQESAANAIAEMKDATIGGRRIRVNWAVQRANPFTVDPSLSKDPRVMSEYDSVLRASSFRNHTVYVGLGFGNPNSSASALASASASASASALASPPTSPSETLHSLGSVEPRQQQHQQQQSPPEGDGANADEKKENTHAATITESMLQDLFGRIGPVRDVRLMADRSYAFVHMTSHEYAALAIVLLNGHEIVPGRTIRCSWGREKFSGQQQVSQGGYSPMFPFYPIVIPHGHLQPQPVQVPGQGQGHGQGQGQGQPQSQSLQGQPSAQGQEVPMMGWGYYTVPPYVPHPAHVVYVPSQSSPGSVSSTGSAPMLNPNPPPAHRAGNAASASSA